MAINWKNNKTNWGVTSKIMHWITVIMVFSLFGVGLWMHDLTYYDPLYKTLPFLHKSFGICLFILTLLRIIWKIINPTPKSLDSHSNIEKILAHLMHIGLYIILLSIMISGYLISTADGRAIEVFGLFSVPALPISLEKQEDIAGAIHFYLAWLIISMVVLHALGALKHHFIDKDNTLKRML